MGDTPAHPDRLHPVAALVLVLVAAAALALPRAQMGDDGVRFLDMVRALTSQKPEQKFSLVGPLCAAPLFYLGRVLGDVERCVWYFNRLLVLGACAAFWHLFRPVLSAAERARFVVALVLVSMMPHHLMFFGGEVFTSVTVSLGLAAVVLRRARWGAPLAVLGTANTPATFVGLGLATLVLVARTRRLRFLLAGPVALGIFMLENYVRRGDPWFSGYNYEHGTTTILPYSGRQEFSYPLFFGLLSVLFSFGKGLVFFVPLLFLPLPAGLDRPPDADDRLRWVYRAWVAYTVGMVLVYAKWWCWSGGWVWGPRFFLFGCFVAALVAARRTAGAARASTGANLLTLAALVLSAWVAVCAQVYGQEGLRRYVPETNFFEFVTWYVPECSALWWPFVTPVPLREKDLRWIAVVATGFCYLAAPVVLELARRAPGYAAAAWRAARAAPFRF